MDKKFAHIELREESADRIRKAIREADLDELRKDPYYVMPEAPELADIEALSDTGETLKEINIDDPLKVTPIGDLARETGHKKPEKTSGRRTAAILRILPLAAAAAVLLMIAVPRLLPTGQDDQGQVSTIDKPDDGGSYMGENQTPSVTSPLIVGQDLTAEAAAESLQAYYGDEYLVEVAEATDTEAVLAISREGEEPVRALISLADGKVVIESEEGERILEGLIGSDGTFEVKD